MTKVEWIEDGPGIQATELNSAQSLIELLRRSSGVWWEDSTMPWVFRGHAQESWTLLPCAWRDDDFVMANARSEAARRFDETKLDPPLHWWWPPNHLSHRATFRPDDERLKRLLCINTNAEVLVLFDLALAMDRQGLTIPLDNVPPDRVDQPNYVYMFGGSPLSADNFVLYHDMLKLTAVAQHHGLPTRLLDWTIDPLAAAFFATEKITEPEHGKKIVVWALNRRHASRAATHGFLFAGLHGAPRVDPVISVLRPPAADNPYMIAQSGVFTTIANSGIHFMQNGGVRPTLEEFVRQSNTQEVVLRKVILPHKYVPDLTQLLNRERVSRSAFMPTRDNIAADVRRFWSQIRMTSETKIQSDAP